MKNFVFSDDGKAVVYADKNIILVVNIKSLSMDSVSCFDKDFKDIFTDIFKKNGPITLNKEDYIFSVNFEIISHDDGECDFGVHVRTTPSTRENFKPKDKVYVELRNCVYFDCIKSKEYFNICERFLDLYLKGLIRSGYKYINEEDDKPKSIRMVPKPNKKNVLFS